MPQVLGIYKTFALNFSDPIILGLIAAVGLLFVFNLALLFLTWRSYRLAKKLFGDTKKEELKKILEEHLKRVGLVQVKIADLEKLVEKIQKTDLVHLQKVAWVRFNPFEDTGSDQSFALALLDGEDNGLVISSLHGRDRTRIYCKPVISGGASDYPLSDEEAQAIQKAIRHDQKAKAA